MIAILAPYFLTFLFQAEPAPAPAPAAPRVVPTLTATAGASKATALTADQVVDKVQAFYKGIEQVTAKFRQTVTNKTFGRDDVNDGVVYIKKPGKMRWDYTAKKQKDKKAAITKSFISNGKQLFVVDKQNKQVLEKNLEKNMLPVAVTFLYGSGDLKRDFTAKLDGRKKYGGKDDLVLELTPKTPSTQYKRLFLVVAKDNHRVKESVIIDNSDNANHFRFYEPNFAKAIQDKSFEFDYRSVPDYKRVKDDDDATAGRKP
jgi:outer membrane lipoprotein carrier protein